MVELEAVVELNQNDPCVLCFQDFGDGGAFPEILLVQYPLGMGQKAKVSNALAKQVDADGKVKYDVLVRQGQNKDKVGYILCVCVFDQQTRLLC